MAEINLNFENVTANEFQRLLQKYRFGTINDDDNYIVYSKRSNVLVARISKTKVGDYTIKGNVQPEITTLIQEFSNTNIQDRIQEKLYYVHLISGDFGYLNIGKLTGEQLLGDNIDNSSMKTIFTLKEISEIEPRYIHFAESI